MRGHVERRLDIIRDRIGEGVPGAEGRELVLGCLEQSRVVQHVRRDAGHRLGGMRRHLQEVAAEPPLTGGLFALPAVLVLLSLTALVFLLA